MIPEKACQLWADADKRIKMPTLWDCELELDVSTFVSKLIFLDFIETGKVLFLNLYPNFPCEISQ